MVDESAEIALRRRILQKENNECKLAVDTNDSFDCDQLTDDVVFIDSKHVARAERWNVVKYLEQTNASAVAPDSTTLVANRARRTMTITTSQTHEKTAITSFLAHRRPSDVLSRYKHAHKEQMISTK